MKRKKFNPQIISLVQNNISSGYHTAEELSQCFQVSRPEIQRALQFLRIQPGWSIQIVNSKPYWRRFGHINYNRHRLKGSKYEHDAFESDWERTRYKVIRPNENLPTKL